MKKKLIQQPFEYWEEKSYMRVIFKEEENDLKKILEKLSVNKEFKINETSYNINGVINLKIFYENFEYEVGIYLGKISVPDYYLSQNFLFNEEEKKDILSAQKALVIFMKFGNSIKKSFHFQLKLAVALVPDLIGIMDESAEKMLPAKWVKMIASSKILPSSKDLFNIQAINGEKNKMWLHTHGLCRCGITELEILDSDKEHCSQHYNLLVTYAMYLLDKKEDFDPIRNGAYIGLLINNNPVVVTCIPWPEGILEYKKLKLGGINDRKEGHNTKTSIVFLYTSEEDEINGTLNKVSIYDELWGENPLFFFSDEETNRMRELAKERFSYVLRSFNNSENSILIKIGLPLKEDGKFEHIWFELLDIKGDKFKAKLTQEPYDIPDIHTGYEAWYSIEDITDWIIYTKAAAINPSNAYILENK